MITVYLKEQSWFVSMSLIDSATDILTLLLRTTARNNGRHSHSGAVPFLLTRYAPDEVVRSERGNSSASTKFIWDWFEWAVGLQDQLPDLEAISWYWINNLLNEWTTGAYKDFNKLSPPNCNNIYTSWANILEQEFYEVNYYTLPPVGR
jgi:hypothetical protein